MRRLAFVLVALAAGASAQTPGASYAAVYGTPGHPDLPLLERLGLEGARTVRVPVPDSSQTLEVVWGESERGPVALVLHRKPDETSITWFGDDTEVGLTLTPGSETRTPLEVRVLEDEGLALYRWPLSPVSAAGGVPTAAPNPLEVGAVPALEVERLGGGALALADLRGRPVVLNWWATTCSPCVAELPGLNALAERYGGRAAFVAVAFEPAPAVEAFLERFAFGYDQTLGRGSAEALFGPAFPRHVVLDARGRVVYDQVGGSEDIEDVLGPHVEAALAR